MKFRAGWIFIYETEKALETYSKAKIVHSSMAFLLSGNKFSSSLTKVSIKQPNWNLNHVSTRRRKKASKTRHTVNPEADLDYLLLRFENNEMKYSDDINSKSIKLQLHFHTVRPCPSAGTPEPSTIRVSCSLFPTTIYRSANIKNSVMILNVCYSFGSSIIDWCNTCYNDFPMNVWCARLVECRKHHIVMLSLHEF